MTGPAATTGQPDRVAGPVALLSVRNLRTGYGSIPVIHGISFEVPEQSVTVLLGLNGAGKTTTINALAGLLPTWEGSTAFGGEDITHQVAEDAVAKGIALSPEGRRVFAGLTVDKNLTLGAWTRKGHTQEIAESRDRVFEYFPRLAERRDQLAGTMSGGEQQMLAIGRALMSRPRLMLIDEASLGLSPKLAMTVFQTVRQIADDGTTVIIVEQNAGVLPFADQALVMEKGVLTYTGSAAVLAESGSLEAAYLG